MKRIVFFILGLGMFLLLFASCQKNKTNIAQQNNRNRAQSEVMIDTIPGLITASAANPSNPYDSYGATHNGLLAATVNVWDDSTATIGSIYTAMVATNLDTIDSPIPSETTVSSIVENVLQHDSASYIISHLFTTNEGEQLADSLFAIFDNWESFDSYVDFRNTIIAFEGCILNNATLEATDKATLLKLSSIMRFSMKYLINFYYIYFIGIQKNAYFAP